MPPTTIHDAPQLDSFTTLAEHQAQTPATFYNAKPVLHYSGSNVRALASQDQLYKLPIFGTGTDATQDTTTTTAISEESALSVQKVDAFVSSE